MKNYRNKLAILLSLIMVISSLSFIVAYAEDDAQAAEPAVAAQEDSQEPAVAAQEGEQDSPSVPTAPVGLKALSGFESVTLKWTAPPEMAGLTSGAGYDVYQGTKLLKSGVTALSYKVSGLDPYTKYDFKVRAYNTKDGAKQYSPDATVTGQPVRNMTYKVQIKASSTLKSHGKVKNYKGTYKSTYKVKKGQWIEVDGYGAGGKYIFARNGNIFYCNLTRTGAKKEIYEKKKNYTREEAEEFVNTFRSVRNKALTSKTDHLVWVSTYTQHVYVFKSSDGSKKFKNQGKWVCYGDWECSTGKAKTPSPTGIDHNKTIWKKVKYRNSKPWWSMYQEINSFHGKLKSWKLGKPASNGCIRNDNSNAKIIYDDCKINTRVLIY